MSTDCPICLSPLCAPWGVAQPCGHPYHRECWEAVVAACSTAKKKKKKECPMCKSGTKGFQQVFVQLGGEENEVQNGGGAVDVSKGNGDALDELKKEWDELWQELEILLSCEGAVGVMKVAVGDLCTDTADDEYQGTQEIQDICATIDLTQSPIRASAENYDSNRQVSLRLVRLKPNQEGHGAEPTEQLGRQSPLKEQQLKQTKIQHILSRLHQIHSTLMDVAPVSKSNHTSQFKSKFLSLQKENSSLESEISRLESENSTIQSKLDTASQALLERNFETEREKRNASNIKQEYTHLYEVHNSYQERATRQIENLKQSNAELQKKCYVLQSANGLRDVKEMEEIRATYSKMSQQLHDVTKENRALTRRIEEMERRRKEGEKITREVKQAHYRKEKVNHQGEETDDYRGVKSRTISKGSGAVDRSTCFKNSSTRSSNNRAMQVLDTAPSRKTIQTKTKAPSYEYHKSEKRTSASYNEIQPNAIRDTNNCGTVEEEELEIDDGIQLFMKPSAASNRYKKRPYSSTTTVTGPTEYNVSNTNQIEQQSKPKNAPLHPIALKSQSSINSVHSATSQTKRMLKESASLSGKSSKKGGASHSISTFFKPIEK